MTPMHTPRAQYATIDICGKLRFAEGVRAFLFCLQTAVVYEKPEPLSKVLANVDGGILYWSAMDISLETIFSQKSVPVVFKRRDGLFVKMPYHRDNYNWLCNLLPRRPLWNPQDQFWAIPKVHFEPITKKLLSRFGCLFLLQHYREKEVCAPACWNAHGLECECSCMGANHGTGQPNGRWYVLGDAYAIQWDDEKVSCQFLIKEQMQ